MAAAAAAAGRSGRRGLIRDGDGEGGALQSAAAAAAAAVISISIWLGGAIPSGYGQTATMGRRRLQSYDTALVSAYSGGG